MNTPERAAAAELLEAGVAEHRAGNVAAAARHYCRTLEAAPENPDALHLLGLLLSEQGEHGRALSLLSRAVELQPHAVYVANLGLALRRAGDLQGAIASYLQALRLDPLHVPTLGRLGRALIDSDDSARAEAVLVRAIQLDFENPELHNALGHARAALREIARARQCFEVALKLDPSFDEAASNLAECVLQEGHAAVSAGAWEDALGAYAAACSHAPALASAWYNRGLAATALRRLDEARGFYERAIDLDFNYAEAHNNLGHLFQASGDTPAAIQAYERALALRPGYTDAQYNLALTLQNSGRIYRAEEQYRDLLGREPAHADARNNLGGIRLSQNRVSEAIHEFETALTDKPTHVDARWNLGLAHLTVGDFARGWPLYETRFEQPNVPRREFACPRWQGEALAGRSVCVWAEQGLGDTIQFVRYLPLLLAQGARVVLEVQPRLAPLLSSLPGIEVHARGDAPPRTDYHVPLLSLPGHFEEIPALWFPVTLAGSRLSRGSERAVGLCWAGHPDHVKGRHRSLPLVELAVLAEVPGVRFYSLQRGPQEAEVDNLPGAWRPEVAERAGGGIDELASIIAGLDLVVTVDTMVAHLAGSLGKPVWTMLPFAADWRWMLEREDSPWYPSMRLFRQSAPGGWPEVVRRVSAALASLR